MVIFQLLPKVRVKFPLARLRNQVYILLSLAWDFGRRELPNFNPNFIILNYQTWPWGAFSFGVNKVLGLIGLWGLWLEFGGKTLGGTFY